MNIGAFGENFPYTNFHDLNLDWILKTMKESLKEVQDGVKTIDEAKQDIENFIASINVRIDGMIEQAIIEALESGDFEELIAAVANQNIYFCVYPSMTQQTIQTAINEHTAIKFTPGTYRVYIPNVNDYGFSIPSDRLIFFDDATILKVGDFSHEYDNLIVINNAHNVKMYGNGTLNYDRSQVEFSTGEHGMCLTISNSTDVSIDGLRFINAFGDGIYLLNNENIYINNVYCNNNRRNAITVISGENYYIENSVFSNSNGTAPEAGISVETNYSTDILYNINFKNCRCSGNTAVHDCYITVFSDDATITLDGIEMEHVTPVLLRGTNSTITITNCRMKTKANSSIFDFETGSGNTIIYSDCYIDGSDGATNLIRYTGSVCENIFIQNTILTDCTLTERAVLALGSREEVGNIHVDLYTKNVSIASPVMLFASTRTLPNIEWSVENSDYKELPVDTVLVFNNYYASTQTRIAASSSWLKQKVRIVNTASATTRIQIYYYSSIADASSLDIPENGFSEFIWYKNGIYDLTPDSNNLDTKLTTIANNTTKKTNTLVVEANSSATFTLPSDGQYLVSGWGAAAAINNILFIIGGYTTASRCDVISLTSQTQVTIDNSNTTELTFTISNANANLDANIVIYQLS